MNWAGDSDGDDDFEWVSDHGEEETGPSRREPVVGSVSGTPHGEVREEAASSRGHLVSHFVGMGFSEMMVVKAIDENGGDDTEAILETLLTQTAIGSTSLGNEETPGVSVAQERSPSDEDRSPNDFSVPSDDEYSSFDFSDDGNLFEEDFFELERGSYEKDKLLSTLVEMGFSAEEASSAIDRCGLSASVLEIADSIEAAQFAKDSTPQDTPSFSRIVPTTRIPCNGSGHYFGGKRRWVEEERRKTKQLQQGKRPCGVARSSSFVDEERERCVWMPHPMIGFSLPNQRLPPKPRNLPDAAAGPPFFYYENVALAPKGVWDTISRFLYDIPPEFVDSKFFCASTRKRGYIHNLPISNRFPILPIPAKTISEALPMTKRWWPLWDVRTQLNCLQTVMASSRLTDRIRMALADSGDPPPQRVQQYVMEECRKWNLVWVGHHKVAPLEPDEIEAILGFPKDHTRGGGISRTERYRSLGNSFQVDTVAYHLSVLKEMFPAGITVLSLFSGIGGAEVALHRLGIYMKAVVSVEILENNRNILRAWWEQTNQKGILLEIADVQNLDGDKIEQFIRRFGGFDLVVGGSPCNNLSGSNRYSRDGLEGEKSSLFYDYFRILDIVKCMMNKNL